MRKREVILFKRKIPTVYLLVFVPILIVLLLLFVRSVEKRPVRANIVYILVDTLRADHLGCYGYDRDTSPRMDQAAAAGFVFNNMISVCPWTNPAIVSLFTGLYPQSIFPPVPHGRAIRLNLPLEVDTMAEILQANGYATLAVVDHPGINEKHNFSQGFDQYVDPFKEEGWHEWSGTDPADVFTACDRLLEQHQDSSFLLYVHVIWPHVPYDAGPAYTGIFGEGHTEVRESEKQGVINDYDAEIKKSDDFVGRIMDSLENKDLLENSFVIITSDHGEAFWEHGLWEHGNSLFNELLQVPLIICPPRKLAKPTGNIPDLLSNVDLFPTVLEMAGIQVPPDIDGLSLLPYVNGQGRPADPIVFSENAHSNIVHGLSCQTKDLKLIYSAAKPIKNAKALRKDLNAGRLVSSYAISEDPGENTDLGKPRKALLGELRARLVEHKKLNDKRRSKYEVLTRPLDKKTRDKLRTLGYIK